MLLNQRLRASLPAKVAAIGFVLVILFGNLWLAMALTGGKAPVWIASGFTLGLALAGLGGVGLAALAVLQATQPAPDEAAEPADSPAAAPGGELQGPSDP